MSTASIISKELDLAAEIRARRESVGLNIIPYVAKGSGALAIGLAIAWLILPQYIQLVPVILGLVIMTIGDSLYSTLQRRNQGTLAIYIAVGVLLLTATLALFFLPECGYGATIGYAVAFILGNILLGTQRGRLVWIIGVFIFLADVVAIYTVKPLLPPFPIFNETLGLIVTLLCTGIPLFVIIGVTTGIITDRETFFQQSRQANWEIEQHLAAEQQQREQLTAQMWLTEGLGLLNERMRGEQDISTLAGNIIQQLCKYLEAQVGALYIRDNEMLRLMGSYAFSQRKGISNEFKIGELLIGQAALEKQTITISEVPDDYICIGSGLGKTIPRHIVISPFLYEDQVVGVIELGTLTAFTPAQMAFLQRTIENIGITFNTAQARAHINELLTKTRQQAEELQTQEEELRTANEELESQTESLRASEAKLRVNQSKLEQVNAELEEKAQALEKNSVVLQKQQTVLDRQNQELRAAQQELEQKAEELAQASKYKSEFLANMSHELRTPLNSLLILANMLAKNEEGNLTPDQVESMQIIHSGGTDLLNLINDILDLSKIEAGKVEFHFAPMALERLISVMQTQFSHLAEEKGLMFEIELAQDAPTMIESDQQRVEQIVKNLLSNAFKFTQQGKVRLAIYRPQPGVNLSKSGLEPAQAIAISVSDTGIGMTPEQQKIVFEAFQQADSSTSRQYGGTGLGLSISRELVTWLGGQIELRSEKDKGSTFTLYLPLVGPRGEATRSGQGEGETNTKKNAKQTTRSKRHGLPTTSYLPHPLHEAPEPQLPVDDRTNLQVGDRVLLLIEDDPKFIKVVSDYAHKKGFKYLLAGDGETGLQLVQTYPTDAIILDLNLPGMSGWEVLAILKDNPNTRHIPVHIMSVSDEDLNAYKQGAIGFLTKPVSPAELDQSFQQIEEFIDREIKALLLVEDDVNLRKSVRKLLEGNDVVISEVGLGQTALEQLAAQHFDCMILDLNLPDMSGFELLNRLDAAEGLSRCPVIVYTGKALSEEENQELLKYADSVIVKGVKSPERLLDETALFLHRVIANLPEEKQLTIKRLHDSETVMMGRNILIVDDDARNAFALSKLLTGKGLKVHIVPNGQKALEMLSKTPIDLVLMDIMMPGMDGYEVMQRIREQPKFRNLPILALTAKAMKGDREKCLAAGASDYLSKPVDPDRLFSMLRVWLSRE